MSSETTAKPLQELNDFQQIELLLDSVRSDATKFYVNGNNSAGTRLRKILLELKNFCHVSRKNVQEIIKERKQDKKTASSSDEAVAEGVKEVPKLKTKKVKAVVEKPVPNTTGDKPVAAMTAVADKKKKKKKPTATGSA